LKIEDLAFVPGDALGSGSFGIVYLRLLNGVKVAYKKFDRKHGTQIKVILKEAILMKNFDHPNIMKLLGIVTNLDNMGFVMDYYEEGSLYDHLHKKNNRLNAQDVKSLILGIISGMAYIHSKQIVHRDLKSPNILMKGMTPVICDFGVARELDDSTLMSTYEGSVAWMAPEIMRREKYDNKCDVFSFAMVLWECANNLIPYLNKNAEEIKKEYGENGKRLPVLAKPNPAINYSIQTLIKRCWTHDPSERPSFSDLLNYNLN